MTMIDSIKARVKDSAGKLIDPDDYVQAISEAIHRYSKLNPAEIVEDMTGNGAHDLLLPAGWINEFSEIRRIEYPVGSVPESFLDSDEYAIYRAPAGNMLRLLTATPETSEMLRITFVVLRTEETIPSVDLDAVCNLASALCLEILANLYAQTSDPTIEADVVNYRSKGSEYAARARRLMQLFKEHMGLKDTDTTSPAAVIADSGQRYPGGAERLTHSRWARNRR